MIVVDEPGLRREILKRLRGDSERTYSLFIYREPYSDCFLVWIGDHYTRISSMTLRLNGPEKLAAWLCNFDPTSPVVVDWCSDQPNPIRGTWMSKCDRMQRTMPFPEFRARMAAALVGLKWNFGGAMPPGYFDTGAFILTTGMMGYLSSGE